MNYNNWKLKLTLLLVSSLTIMSVVTISPALPEIKAFFGDNSNVDFLTKILLTIPALFIAISGIVVGPIIDKFGRLRFLGVAMLLYALAGTAGYWLEDMVSIIISRAVLGIAVGITMTIVTTLVADYYEGKSRQKFIGLQIAFMSIGGIVFLGLGGFLADFGWRFTFLIYAFSLLILPFALIFLKEPDHVRKIALQDTDVQSPRLIWLLFFNTMLMWVIFFLIPVQIPFFLKEMGVESNALIGIAIAMSTASSAVTAFSFARLREHFSADTIFTLGYLLMAIAFVILGLAGTYWIVVVSMILSGLGMGMMIANTNTWVMKIAPVAIRGREIGRLTTFWFLGQFLSPIILLPITSQLSLSATFYLVAIVLLGLGIFFQFRAKLIEIA